MPSTFWLKRVMMAPRPTFVDVADARAVDHFGAQLERGSDLAERAQGDVGGRGARCLAIAEPSSHTNDGVLSAVSNVHDLGVTPDPVGASSSLLLVGRVNRESRNQRSRRARPQIQVLRRESRSVLYFSINRPLYE